MEKNTIVLVQWDPGNEKSSGLNYFIGRHRGTDTSEFSGDSSLLLYGIGLEGIDTEKDCQLHGYSLHEGNVKKCVVDVGTKEEMRAFLLSKIDLALDHLYSEDSIKEADEYDEYIKNKFQQASMEINKQ